MAQNKFAIKTGATKPLYAYVGVTDRAVEVVRDSVADLQKRLAEVQKDVQSRVAGVQKIDLESLTKEAQARRGAVEARVAELQDRAKALPEIVQALLEQNEVTYSQLVARGETLVTRIRKQDTTQAAVKSAKTSSAKAKTTTTQASKAGKSTAQAAKKAARTTADNATKQSKAPKSSAKATGTTAKRAATNASKATVQATKKVGD
jgi:heparin binding hemagglutinin HbhA